MKVLFVYRHVLFSFALFSFLFLGHGTADADIIRVPFDFISIQGAIEFAVNGDTVLVDSGTYAENINIL